MKRAMVLLLLTTLCACNNLPIINKLPIIKDATSTPMDKWVGRPADDLVVAFGTPTDVFMLDSGGRIFEYFKSKVTGVSSESAKRARGKHFVTTGYDLNGKPVGYFVGDDMTDLRKRPQRPKDDACMVLFRVTASNIIESWSTEGDACD